VSYEEAHSPAGQEPFSAEERSQLHAADIHAARQVVGLMVGVFTFGLFLYLVVALTF
jgi:hypothetical protein